MALDQLEHEQDVALRYGPLVQEIFGRQAAGLRAFQLFIVAGAIMDDPEFSARHDKAVAAWRKAKIAEYGDNFMISEGVGELEEKQQFPLRIAEALTRAEKLLLSARLQKAGVFSRHTP
jgi:hypothetical protein